MEVWKFNIEEVIRKEVEAQIEHDYTEYKKKKLSELDYELERKRNQTVTDIINSITIMNENTPNGLNVMIRLENKIILNKWIRWIIW